MNDIRAERASGTSANRKRGRSRQQVLVSQDRWLVSYADFMTLLFALFVVLFATSRHSPAAFGTLSGAIQRGFTGTAQPASVPPAEPAANRADPRVDTLEAELRTALAAPMQRQEVSVEQNADGLVLSFQELGFFRSGEANVLPGQSDLILQAAAILKRHGARLRVEGHSDDQPIHTAVFSSNWELSAARAMTVLLLLVNDAHYDPTALSMAGYGPYRPVGDNQTVEGRQRNRRVNLVVISREQGAAQGREGEPGTEP